MTEEQDKKGRTWGMFCHLAGLLAFIGIPFGNLLGPLVIWLVLKNDYPIVDEQGKESLNFQISVTLYCLVSAILVFILIGFGLLVVIAIADIILVIMATVKVSQGESFRYPLTLRLIK